MDYSQIICGAGENLFSISYREYGQVEGVQLIIEDNPGVITEVDQLFVGGEVLNIRLNAKDSLPDAGLFDFARGDKGIQVVNVIPVGLSHCPSLTDQLASTDGNTIKADLQGVGKLDDVIVVMSNSELDSTMTDSQKAYFRTSGNQFRLITGYIYG